MSALESVHEALQRLSELRQRGLITGGEYETRRIQLIDMYIGVFSNGPTSEQNSSSSAGATSTGIANYSPALRFEVAPPITTSAVSININAPRVPVWPSQLTSVTPHASYAPLAHFLNTLSIDRTLQARGMNAYSTVGRFSVKVQPLPSGLTTGSLVAAFAIFGPVTSAVVKGGSPNYGRVNFEDQMSMDAALAKGQLIIGGTLVRILPGKARLLSKGDCPPSNGIALLNLPYATTYNELYFMLKDYPGFRSIKMVESRNTKKFRGYAFVYFDTVDNATQAKAKLAGLTLSDEEVVVKFARQWRNLPKWDI